MSKRPNLKDRRSRREERERMKRAPDPELEPESSQFNPRGPRAVERQFSEVNTNLTFNTGPSPTTGCSHTVFLGRLMLSPTYATTATNVCPYCGAGL